MAPAEMLLTLAVALVSYTLVFVGIARIRYVVELLEREGRRREAIIQ